MTIAFYSHRFFLLSAFIILASFLAYLPALQNGFVLFDTASYIIHNPHIKSFSLENLQWMLFSFEHSNWHPLTWFSHAIDYHLFGLSPFGHHLHNVIIHSLNSVLVVYFILLLCRQQKLAEPQQFGVAGLSAILFAIHPQHVESVVWVAERKDVLSVFFMLLTFISYIHYTQATTQRFRWYFMALLCFVLALMAKPMAVTLPALLLVLDLYPLKRLLPSQSNWQSVLKQTLWQRLILEKLPFWLLTFASIVFTLAAQSKGGAVAALTEIDLVFRLVNAAHSVLFYLEKLFYPSTLLPFYPYPSGFTYPLIITIFSLLVLILGICLYFAYKGQLLLLSAVLFYLISLSPVVGIIQVGSQAAADRYAYLPTLPFYVLFSLLVVYLWSRSNTKFIKGLYLTSLAWVFLALTLKTQAQSQLWHNGIQLWDYTLQHTPNTPVPHRNLAIEYLARDNYAAATYHAEKSAKLSKQNELWLLLARVHLFKEQWEAAIDALNKIESDRNAREQEVLGNTYTLLAYAYLKLGNQAKFQQAFAKMKNSPEPNHDYSIGVKQQLLDFVEQHPEALSPIQPEHAE